ncbi:MAG: lipopolysaccharide kinase InaA family protein [Acidobacteriota bacterium]
MEGFRVDGWSGEVLLAHRPIDLAAAVRKVVDPTSAEATLHWGRSYLYGTSIETADGRLGVVVKLYRNQSPRRRLDRKLRGSRAERSWRTSRLLHAAGIGTPTPVLWIESEAPDGPSLFVSRWLEGRVEVRYILRALSAGTLAEAFPRLDRVAFLEALGAFIGGLHAEGVFHRDLSIGNVLLPDDAEQPSPDDFQILDLSRARIRDPIGWAARYRDLCRLTIHRPVDQRIFLRGYWGREPTRLQRATHLVFHRGFYGKLALKRAVRAPLRKIRWSSPRRPHAHLEAAPEGASRRDKIVWDPLTEQPHQHASRREKNLVRLADAPSHLRDLARIVRRAPAVVRRYRQLQRDQWRQPVDWPGVGVAVRPRPEAPETVAAEIEALGVEHVLLRLHPWEDDDRHEETLARTLHARGIEVAFALPQTREMVRDPGRWRARVEELVDRFAPFGRDFQIGQAINRSKWGVWKQAEYRQLARSAVEVVGARGGRAFGPAVIDFEPHALLAALHHPRQAGLDGVASLLYVDRRGAPERRQLLVFDTPAKAWLVRAIGETSPHRLATSWITEVNWPLREGPHAPAGRDVAVDEAQQADYLARFFLLTLATGAADRAYWWRIFARGYGLVEPREEGDRRRPAWHALATLQHELRGGRCVGRLASRDGVWALLFDRPAAEGENRRSLIVAWSTDGETTLDLPAAAVQVVEQDGRAGDSSLRGPATRIDGSVRYFHFDHQIAR